MVELKDGMNTREYIIYISADAASDAAGEERKEKREREN